MLTVFRMTNVTFSYVDVIPQAGHTHIGWIWINQAATLAAQAVNKINNVYIGHVSTHTLNIDQHSDNCISVI